MNSLPIACKDAATTFLLARRAERLARPLIEQVGDAWRLSITVTLGDNEYAAPWHISIYAHYAMGAAEFTSNMPVYESCIVTSAQLDRAIEKMRRLAAKQVSASRRAAVGGEDADA